ncbi:MAG: VWA domain-containing protein [Phycisphaerae bacterium]|nr:VWA domain-containing protein [Phycisphaerae bacterium]
MKRKTAMRTAAMAACLGLALIPAGAKTQNAPQPVVEVAFVLDTTGSMSGLIEGAKKKIWSIANQTLLGEPRPKVRMALVGYRDKGDEYVTKVFPLTDNIDEVYENLTAFRADGGGDGPENVNQALHDAIHKLGWSKDRRTLKIIYLVGDFPPHNEYQDVPTYDKLAKQAIESGIYVNTILCGGNPDARKVWQEIARMAEGNYFAIAQDGGMQEIATPYDEDLAKLNTELIGTVVVYGDAKAQREAGERNESVAASMAKPTMAPASAERASFASKTGQAGSGDLLRAVEQKKVSLRDMKADELPPEMRNLTPQQREEYIQKQQAKRDTINAKIKKLSEKRSVFLRKAVESNSGAKDGFDAKVLEALRAQAARKDITYK